MSQEEEEEEEEKKKEEVREGQNKERRKRRKESRGREIRTKTFRDSPKWSPRVALTATPPPVAKSQRLPRRRPFSNHDFRKNFPI